MIDVLKYQRLFHKCSCNKNEQEKALRITSVLDGMG